MPFILSWDFEIISLAYIRGISSPSLEMSQQSLIAKSNIKIMKSCVTKGKSALDLRKSHSEHSTCDWMKWPCFNPKVFDPFFIILVMGLLQVRIFCVKGQAQMGSRMWNSMFLLSLSKPDSRAFMKHLVLQSKRNGSVDRRILSSVLRTHMVPT